MNAFFRKHAILLGFTGAASLLFSIALLFFTVRSEVSDFQTLVLKPQEINYASLPGPKGLISEKSKLEIEALLNKLPSVIGAWVTELEDTGPGNLIYYWGRDPLTTKAMGDFYNVVKLKSDATLANRQLLNLENALRHSEEIKNGLIKCESITIDSTHIQGICYSSLPPFSTEVNIAFVVFILVPANSPEFMEIRRNMLRLQIDIFNRDYRGRETWVPGT